MPCQRFASHLLLAFLLLQAPLRVQGAEHTKESLASVQANLTDGKAVLIDVREPKEWKQGHLRDAMSVPLSELKGRLDDPAYAAELTAKLPKSKIVYCHCASGVRVLPAADQLEKLGYDVRALKSGYRALVAAGFESVDESDP